MMNLSTAMSGKTRAFISFESSLDLLIENFSVRNDEEVLLIKHGTPLQKLIDMINASRAEKFFFILVPNFPFDVLKEAGLVYGKDFINGFDFLLMRQEPPPLSYSLLAEM